MNIDLRFCHLNNCEHARVYYEKLSSERPCCDRIIETDPLRLAHIGLTDCEHCRNYPEVVCMGRNPIFNCLLQCEYCSDEGSEICDPKCERKMSVPQECPWYLEQLMNNEKPC